ncbi:MAG: hypothetical protein V3U89_06590 [Methylophilaceae bacterium]
MQIRKLILLAVYTSVLSACSATAATAVTTPVVPSNKDSNNSGITFSPIAHAHTAELLEFIAAYADLAHEKQKITYLEVMQKLAKNKEEINLRIKHAAMLSLPSSYARDIKTAQKMLQALLEDDELNDSNASLVNILYTFTLDLNKQSHKVRELAKKNDGLKQKNKALVQKLNDLKDIEKTMIERNAQTNKKP